MKVASALSARDETDSSWAISAGRRSAAAVIAAAAWSAEASVALTFCDRAALAQLGDQQANLGERLGELVRAPGPCRRCRGTRRRCRARRWPRSTSWSSGSASTRAGQRAQVVDQLRQAGRRGVDVGRGALGRGDGLGDLGPEVGRAQLVGELAQRGERRVDVLDRAAAAQVRDQAARLVQRGVDRAGQGGGRVAAHQRVDAVDGAGGRGDEVVERQRPRPGRSAPARPRRRRRTARW